MSEYALLMPKMGESVIEAKIIRWLKKPGDTIAEDEPICEIATDKVDSEIPSPVAGIVKELKYKENDVVEVGKVIAIIETDTSVQPAIQTENTFAETQAAENVSHMQQHTPVASFHVPEGLKKSEASRFYSPLVRTIARAENISIEELDSIQGSGKDGRVTKDDLLKYIEQKRQQNVSFKTETPASSTKKAVSPSDTIIEMDRMRRLIADHMVQSVKTSPHVTSFIEVRMGKVVSWREKIKQLFEQKFGEKITYTHIFIEAAARALLEFPTLNASIDGYQIILKKHINIGIATALPDGNLIVPVIKRVEEKNLLGIVQEANRLVRDARDGKLKPDDIVDGTFSITNLGTFGTLTGTPIIHQPQVAILSIGTIQKKPVVIETPNGDALGIDYVAILSLSYDHRLIDGALGGQFLKWIAYYLENFDTSRTF